MGRVAAGAEADEAVEAGSPINTPPPPGTDGKADSTGSSEVGADLIGVEAPVSVADPVGEEEGYSASDSSEVGATLVALSVAVGPATTDDPGVVVCWPDWGIASGTAEYGKSPLTVLILG